MQKINLVFLILTLIWVVGCVLGFCFHLHQPGMDGLEQVAWNFTLSYLLLLGLAALAELRHDILYFRQPAEAWKTVFNLIGLLTVLLFPLLVPSGLFLAGGLFLLGWRLLYCLILGIFNIASRK